jgi:hypothetical protein
LVKPKPAIHFGSVVAMMVPKALRIKTTPMRASSTI